MKLPLPNFAELNILIVGDVMLDQYWHGSTFRISPEAPVPIVSIKNEVQRAGGAANVAVNIVALGASALVLGLTGNDASAMALEKCLADAGVDTCFVRQEGYSTITKLRVISHNQQLIRLDFEDGIQGGSTPKLIESFASKLSTANAVILSDYGKGVLVDADKFIQLARRANKPILVDPKGTEFEKYRGATVVTPNQSEFEAIVGPCRNDDELCEKGEQLRQHLELDALLITRSERGMTLIQRGNAPQHLPAQAHEVFDVTGAGDTAISALAAGIAAGMDLGSATELANLAAGVVVGKLGTASVTVSELRQAIHSLQSQQCPVLSEEALIAAVENAKLQGEKIVLVSGCFDILLAEHVDFISRASCFGARMIVVVLDDCGMSPKGVAINTVSHRMAMVAALRHVEWVVSLSEQALEKLVQKIKPNVMVRGQDVPLTTKIDQRVVDNGGEVVIFDFNEKSSTDVVYEAIRR